MAPRIAARKKTKMQKLDKARFRNLRNLSLLLSNFALGKFWGGSGRGPKCAQEVFSHPIIRILYRISRRSGTLKYAIIAHIGAVRGPHPKRVLSRLDGHQVESTLHDALLTINFRCHVSFRECIGLYYTTHHTATSTVA